MKFEYFGNIEIISGRGGEWRRRRRGGDEGRRGRKVVEGGEKSQVTQEGGEKSLVIEGEGKTKVTQEGEGNLTQGGLRREKREEGDRQGFEVETLWSTTRCKTFPHK